MTALADSRRLKIRSLRSVPLSWPRHDEGLKSWAGNIIATTLPQMSRGHVFWSSRVDSALRNDTVECVLYSPKAKQSHIMKTYHTGAMETSKTRQIQMPPILTQGDRTLDGPLQSCDRQFKIKTTTHGDPSSGLSYHPSGMCLQSRGSGPRRRESRQRSGARSASELASPPRREGRPAPPAGRWPPGPGGKGIHHVIMAGLKHSADNLHGMKRPEFVNGEQILIPAIKRLMFQPLENIRIRRYHTH